SKHLVEKEQALISSLTIEQKRFKKWNDAFTETTSQIKKMEDKKDKLIHFQNEMNDVASYIKLVLQKKKDLKDFKPDKSNLIQLRKRRETIKEHLEEYQILIDKANKKAKIHEYWITAFKEIRLNLIDQVLEEMGMVVT